MPERTRESGLTFFPGTATGEPALKKIASIIFLVVSCISCAFHQVDYADDYRIELYDTDIGKVVHAAAITPRSAFTLKYIHSVEKTPVYETYRITPAGEILLVETHVKSSGYGLPEASATGCYHFKNGWLHVTDFNRKIAPLIFRVSYLNDMLLIFEDHIVNLPNIATPGHRIEVRLHQRI